MSGIIQLTTPVYFYIYLNLLMVQLFLEVGRIDLNNNMKKNLYSAGDPPTQIILVGLITKLEVLMMEEASKRLPMTTLVLIPGFSFC